MRVLWFFIALALVSTSVRSTKIRASKRNIARAINLYQTTGDIDDFCEMVEAKTGKRCVVDFGDEDDESFLKVIKEQSHGYAVAYAYTYILETDKDLQLTKKECKRMWNSVLDLDSEDKFDSIIEEITSRGYKFTPHKTNDEYLNEVLKSFEKLGVCNLGSILGPLGEIDAGYFRNILKDANLFDTAYAKAAISVGEAISKAAKHVKNRIIKPDMIDSIDDEIAEEKEKLQKGYQSIKDRTDTIADLDKKCLMDDCATSCKKAKRMKDELLLKTLGVWAIYMTRHTEGCRDLLYIAAQYKEAYDTYTFTSGTRNIVNLMAQVAKHWEAVALLLAVTYLWFRPDMQYIASILLASVGFAIIPGAYFTRLIGKKIIERARGLMVVVSLIVTTYLLNTGFINPFQGLVVVYLAAVATHCLSEELSTRGLILVSAPMALYAVYHMQPSVNMNMNFSLPSMQTGPGLDFSRLTIYEAPGLLATISIALCLMIFILGNYCDTLGGAIYRDVVNKRSKQRPIDFTPPNPTISQFFSSAFGGNVVILIVCLSLPALLHQGAWVTALSATIIAVFTAAISYQWGFHDEFIREGENISSTPDRILQTMNIIAGSTPRAVILPRFQHLVMATITTVAALTGLRINFGTGMVIGLLVALMLYSDKGKLGTYLSWTCGISLVLSGSILHSGVGLIYLIAKVGEHMYIDTSRFNYVGDHVRDVNVE